MYISQVHNSNKDDLFHGIFGKAFPKLIFFRIVEMCLELQSQRILQLLQVLRYLPAIDTRGWWDHDFTFPL